MHDKVAGKAEIQYLVANHQGLIKKSLGLSEADHCLIYLPFGDDEAPRIVVSVPVTSTINQEFFYIDNTMFQVEIRKEF